VVCGFRVRRRVQLKSRFVVGAALRAYIRMESDLEHIIRWDAEGVTKSGVSRRFKADSRDEDERSIHTCEGRYQLSILQDELLAGSSRRGRRRSQKEDSPPQS
jgi:hypothetical protein